MSDTKTRTMQKITYFYPDTRPGAAAPTFSEYFLIDPTTDSFSGGAAVDTSDWIAMQNVEITVRPGWLWREVINNIQVPVKS